DVDDHDRVDLARSQELSDDVLVVIRPTGGDHVDRVGGGRLFGKGGPDAVTQLGRKLGDDHPVGLESVCGEDAGTPGVGDDPHARAFGNRLVGEDAGRVEQFHHRVDS